MTITDPATSSNNTSATASSWDTTNEVLDTLDEALPRLSDRDLMTVLARVEIEREDRNDEDRNDSERAWSPWRELRRREHLSLRWCNLHRARGRIVQDTTPRRIVFLRPNLGRREREVLTHELTHDDRGMFRTSAPMSMTAVEEAVVRSITEERMKSSRAGIPAPSIHRVTGGARAAARRLLRLPRPRS